jgi:hypothetical protein
MTEHSKGIGFGNKFIIALPTWPTMSLYIDQ